MRQVAGYKIGAGAVITVFGLIALAAIWADVWWDLRSQRSELVRQSANESANLSRVLAEHAQRTIMGLDQTLLNLKADYERDPNHFSIERSAATLVALRHASVQVARIAANGLLADSSVPGFAQVDLSDREHFAVHKQNHTKSLFISRPLQGRVSGQWSIQLTRRLEKPDGSFDGVMVVSMDPHYLSGIYASVNLGSRGLIMLLGEDGLVRAGSDGAVGKALQDPQSVQRIFALSADSQSIMGPADSVARIGSASALSLYPLAIWVGRAEDDVLALHDKSIDNYVLAATVGTLVVLLGAILMLHMTRHQGKVVRDLSQKKAELSSSREALRSYAADLERIANVAAHDLQEPLRRVVAYAQLLSGHVDQTLDQQGRDYVSHVVDGALHMRKLVKDLESFVAVDHMPLPRQLVDAGLALTQATNRLEHELQRAEITVIVDLLPRVAADTGSLSEIFLQLLDNVIRYRVPGRQTVVHVSARIDGDVAQLSIRDNGRGIERQNLSRVFELFNRLNGFDQSGHTGIGLAIARRMIERMGGKIWVESTVGEGSTFRFTLPMVVRPSLMEGEATAAAA